MEFTFSAPLGVMHKIKLVCQLSIYFGVDYQRVSTYDGYYCSELLGSRLLLAKDMTDMVDTKSIIQSAEGKRQLSASPSAVRLLSEFPNMTTIYFGINNKNGKDDSFGKILSESNQLLLLSTFPTTQTISMAISLIFLSC